MANIWYIYGKYIYIINSYIVILINKYGQLSHEVEDHCNTTV